MRRRPIPLSCVAALCLLWWSACSTPPVLVPPMGQPAPAPTPAVGERPAFAAPATRNDEVFDSYHGTEVADPYRWLEDQDGAETAAFVAAQNAASRAFLDAISQRGPIHERLRELWNFPRASAPEHHGDTWFWTHNDGLQNQSVWLLGTTPADEGHVLLDPNTLSADGTTALAGFQPSEDGRLVAYATSASGSDWQEWHVLDVATRQPLTDRVQWAKFTSAAWTTNGKGFFYQRYPAPKAGEVYQAANRNAQLCYHQVGTEQAADRVVYERPDEPEWSFGAEVTESGRFLVVTVRSGTDRRNRIVHADLTQEGWPVQTLLNDFDAHYDFLGHDGDTFWFHTDQGAPRGRIVALDRNQPRDPWRTLVAEQADTLQQARVLGGHFVCTYLTDAAHRIAVHTLDGSPKAAIALPTLGSVGEFEGKAADPVAFFTFQSFAQPPTVMRHDFATAQTTVFRPSACAFDASGIVTERRFLQSGDGTRLCLFLVHKQDMVLDGSNPTYLYGYGGFDISLVPSFSVQNMVFLERGGLYAHAILRGGGEYGEAWHRAGMREHKQHVFDDFVACAEFLIRNGYTRTDKLAVGGRSNGGLLVGAVLTQRPDLFGAAIPEVGVLDMLRYHRFTIGAAWAPEYGTSSDPEQFRWLFAWSPLHRVRAGEHYPPTLVMTGDHDDRVLPGHSYKFAATLQAAQGGDAPILLRVEPASGHGAGKPVSKLIDEAADRWAFLAAVLGS